MKKFKIPFILFTLDLFARLIYLFNTDNNFFGDATARLMAIMWQSKGLNLLPHTDWLPFPFWLNGFVSGITNDLVFTPRIISVVTASLCIFPLFSLVKNIFSKETAIKACLLFTCSFQLLLIESLTLSEPFFHLFSLVIVCSIFQNKNTPITDTLFGFSATAICLTRLEGWVICGLVFIYTVITKQKRNALIIFIGAGIGVVSWELISVYKGHGFLRALLFSDHEVRKMYLQNGWKTYESLYRTLMGYSFLSFLGYILSPIFFRYEKIKMKYFLLVLSLSILPFYKVLNQTLFAEFRYFTIYSIFLLPTILYPLNKISNFNLRQIAFSFLLIGGFLLDFTWVESRFDHLEKRVQLNKGFKKSYITFSEKALDRNTLVYIDFDGTWDRDLWAVYSNLFEKDPQKVCYVESHSWLGKVFTKDSFEKCIENRTQVELITFPNGILEKFIQENEASISEKFVLSELFSSNGYKIIRMTAQE